MLDKLYKVQQKSIVLQKDEINPHFGNRYISLNSLLEAVLPVLNEEGLVLIQTVTNVDGVPALATAIADAETGESLSDTMMLAMDKATPQGQGSAITYARRYALMSMLGLVADEDDDGERAEADVPKFK